MTEKYGIVDLFSGPGGLGEGFSAVTDDDGARVFNLEVSIEKEPSAHSTLLLRSFLRKFTGGFPSEYYDFLNGRISEPDWSKVNSSAWGQAKKEALCMALGTSEARDLLKARIPEIRRKYSDRTILIGGPPCQAYSLAGRSRNAGKADYVPHKDDRNFLYKEYVKVLRMLEPCVFVMENVKGMLSSAVNGDRIFLRVMSDLQNAAGKDSYVLLPLAAPVNTLGTADPSDFVVRSEHHGIPQARHRVIVIGVQRHLAEKLQSGSLPLLAAHGSQVNFADVLGGLPKLRSGLSKADGFDAWAGKVEEYCNLLANQSHWANLSKCQQMQAIELLLRCRKNITERRTYTRSGRKGTELPVSCHQKLRHWLQDEGVEYLPNHETRGHMPEDLGRYLFASVFAAITGKSAKARDFPGCLAPDHKNWKSGKFSDRFRAQLMSQPSTTITSHISKDGHYYIHPDPSQCRSLTVREAARLQTFPDNYYFKGNRTQQYVQVGNAVPPYLAWQIGESLYNFLESVHPCGPAGEINTQSVAAMG